MRNKINALLVCCCQNFSTCCLVGLFCAWKKMGSRKRDSTLLLSSIFLILYLLSYSEVRAVFGVAPGWVSAVLAAYRPCSVEYEHTHPSGMSPHIPLRYFLTQRASLHNLRKPDVPVHLPTETFLVKIELVLDFFDYFPSPDSHQFHAWASSSLLQFIQVVTGNIIAMDVFLRYLEPHPFSVHPQ